MLDKQMQRGLAKGANRLKAVIKMKILQRNASILLIVCLFLPLSKCMAKKEIKGNIHTADTYLQGPQDRLSGYPILR